MKVQRRNTRKIHENMLGVCAIFRGKEVNITGDSRGRQSSEPTKIHERFTKLFGLFIIFKK